MFVTRDAALRAVKRASHVCWVVDATTSYADVAAQLLEYGAESGLKPLSYGDGQGTREASSLLASLRADSEAARGEGFAGVLVVAAMDTLLPTDSSTEAIVSLEVALDALVAELGATLVCAYPSSVFDTSALIAALCVHPARLGSDQIPQFRVTAGVAATWHVSGDVDVAVTSTFAAAVRAVSVVDPCVLDVASLEFIDVAGMRIIAEAARANARTIVLQGASSSLRRHWALCRFDEFAPTVAFTR